MGRKAEQDNTPRVDLGGSWFDPPAFARVASRSWLVPGGRYDFLGVRLVRHRSALERLVEALRSVDSDQR